MSGRKHFLQQIGMMAGTFSVNSLFNELHAAEISAANKKVNHFSATDLAIPLIDASLN